jgi:hypothetical protein
MRAVLLTLRDASSLLRRLLEGGQASVHENISPFAHFLGWLAEKGLRGEPYPDTP